jgi:hypothetical protein
MTSTTQRMTSLPSISEGGYVMPRSILNVNFTSRIIGGEAPNELSSPQRKLAQCRTPTRKRLT